MAKAPEPEAPLMSNHPSRSIDNEVTCHEIANGATDFLEGRLPTIINMKVSDHLVPVAGPMSYRSHWSKKPWCYSLVGLCHRPIRIGCVNILWRGMHLRRGQACSER